MSVRRGRRRKLLIAVLAAVVLAGAGLLAGPPLYASWVNSKTKAPPKLEGRAGGSGPFAASALSGAWTVGGSSFAGYRVKEVLRGNDVTVTGRTSRVRGALRLADAELTTARFSVDVAGIKTSESTRDAYFRGEELLDTDRYPKATFALTEPVDVAALADGRAHAVRLRGDLTVHGVRRAVSFTARAKAGPDRAKIVGSIPVTFQDYGIRAPSLGYVKVEKQGSVEFSLSAAPS
ncbi:MAG: YceI family protein [Streptomyces sp.]|uniref:YceI family protein n=1 Tax=Streptomyces sp. TaxID=1931 RepID=UPI003D6A6C97